MRPLRQQNLLLEIHDNHPLQPMTMTRMPLGLLFRAADEEGADGIIGEPGAIDGGSHWPPSPSTQTTHGFIQAAIHRVIFQSPQEAIQRGVVGHGRELQGGTQLLVLAQARRGLPEGPVFVTHQAEHRQQLRLGELMFAETRAVGRQNLRGHARKGQQSDLGHCPSCSIRKHRLPLLVDSRNTNCAEDVNRAMPVDD